MVDTNSDPREVDYVIPSNDDASKSISKVLHYIAMGVSEGLLDRKVESDVDLLSDDTDLVEKSKASKAAVKEEE